jgi:hypothetical protein
MSRLTEHLLRAIVLLGGTAVGLALCVGFLGSANAQTANAPAPTPLCGRTTTPATKLLLLTDQKAGDAPACMPSQAGGKGTAATVRTNEAGAVVWWYCPVTESATDPKLKGYALQFWANTWSRVLTSRFDIDAPVSDPRYQPVWCPYWDAMLAGVPDVPVPPPPPPAMATSSTLAYRLSPNGKALAGISGSVKRGLACDCTTPLKLGSLTYCAYAGAAAGVVAQCAPPKP